MKSWALLPGSSPCARTVLAAGGWGVSADEILALRSICSRWPVTSQSTCGLEEAGKGWGGIAGLSRAVRRRSGLSEKVPSEPRLDDLAIG